VLGTSIAQNQKAKGSGFKAKGEVNSPKVEPPMNRVEERVKRYKRYVKINGTGESVRFRF